MGWVYNGTIHIKRWEKKKIEEKSESENAEKKKEVTS